MAHATTQAVTELVRAVRRNADIVRAVADGAAAGQPRAVHRMRVASRRLRAAWPIAAALGRVDSKSGLRKVRQLTRAFGAARDAEVALAWLKSAPARNVSTPETLGQVHVECELAREAGLRAARARLSRLDIEDLVAGAHLVADRAEHAASPIRAASVLASAVGRQARQLSAAIAEAGTTYGVDSLHQVRLRTKKLRYGLEAASGLLGAPADQVRHELKRLQARLGKIHDAQSVQRYIRIAAAAKDVTRPMMASLDALDRVLDTRSRRLHARMVADKPAIDETVRVLRRSVTAQLSTRRSGRMMRMPVEPKRRRTGTGA